MATIADIIRTGSGRAGSGGAWRAIAVRDSHGREVRELWHYATLMLRWSVADPADPAVLDWSTGRGSVSDQGGMNVAFRELGLPYRFDRDQRGGGPRISPLAPAAAEPEPDESDLNDALAESVEHALPDLTLIGDGAARELRALVYGAAQEV